MGVDVLQPVATGGSLVDVSDRAGRLLGVVTSITNPVDVSDRAARLLGVISTAQLPAALLGGRLDVNIGSPATLPVSLAAAVDVSDRAGRLLGVVSGTVSATQGTTPWSVDVTRWNGGVPQAAGILPDATSQSAGPFMSAYLAILGSGSFDRVRAANSDAQAATGIMAAGNMGWNGLTWDRLKSTTANGLVADVSRVQGTVAVSSTQLPAALVGGRLDVNIGAPATLPVSLAAAVDVSDRAARLLGIITSSQTTPADALANTAGLPVVAENELWNGASWDRAREPNADGLTNAVGIAAAGIVGLNSTGAWDRIRGTAVAGLRVTPRRLAHATQTSVANTVQTLTLAAPGAGLFYYIYAIKITRFGTAAVAGGTVLGYTSTQLNGWGASVGSFYTITAPQVTPDVDESWSAPLRSDTANTAVTVVAPAAGATVQTKIEVLFFTDVDQG